MWLSFFFVALIAVGLLYLPGYLLLSVAARQGRISYLLVAPLLSVSVIEICSILFAFAALPYSLLTVLPFLFVAILVFYLYGRCRGGEKLNAGDQDIPLSSVFLYVIFGIAISAFFFVLPLDGADSFNQDHDNVFHLNLIQSFIASGNMSPLSASVYRDASVTPFLSTGSFYPAAWHSIAALCAETAGTAPAVAANALNAVLIGVVFPCSMCYLMNKLFGSSDKGVLFFGALITLAFSAFPWGFATFGPLYPNLFGMAICPLFVGFIVCGIRNEEIRIHSAGFILMVFSGAVSLALAHTNALFSAALFLIPFLIDFACRKASPGKQRCCAFVLAVLIVLLIWTGAFFMPFMHGVVWYNWPAEFDFAGAVAYICSGSLNAFGPQALLAFFVVLGSLGIMLQSQNRWIVLSLVLAVLLFVVSIGTEGVVKHYLTGFWYTDSHRLAATIVLCSIPVASYGLNLLCSSVCAVFDSPAGKKFLSAGVAVTVLAMCFVVVKNKDGSYLGSTVFGGVESSLEKLNDSLISNLVDPEERSFIASVKGIAGNQLVLNSPEDGSFFGYGLVGLNTYYRQTAITDDANQTRDSLLIKNDLYKYGSDPAVNAAVKNIGAKYVMLLDQGGEITAERHTYGYYDPDEWCGFNSITDSTSGFNLILSEGDCRLYEIVY